MSEAKGDSWGTPDYLYEWAKGLFGPFDTDPATSPDNPLNTSLWYTGEPGKDGLKRPWFGRVFLNPPYSKPRPWLARAASEIENGNAELVFALLKYDTSTRWWNEVVAPSALWIHPIPQRVRYRGATQVANFPSVWVLWRNEPVRPKHR